MDRFEPQRELLNRSGIPFQLAVEREVRRVAPTHAFEFVGREVPWERGFLDLLVRNPESYVGIECKRVENQSWTFVVTNEEALRETRCRLEWYNPRVPEGQVFNLHDSNVFCSEFTIVEPCPESEFCVIPKGGPIKTLEEIASEVLSACHDILDRGDLYHPQDRWESIVPVIMTNATLLVCQIDLSKVDLPTGRIDSSTGVFREVKWVRFRKTLVHDRSNTYSEDPLRPSEWIADRERTVFVMRPEALSQFMHGFRAFGCRDHGGHPKEFSNPDSIRAE